ncbi:lipopolysaccharide export system permease protein [Sphingomonas gellani]|uniref:Lipopolysaccharide export system permease protein n=1 Tax=Sphingomonas gellani TaxID=1166340 RepID=A0A1H8FLE6_9SPHN|nr:LPS export ABC transporter permease LptG [Sphingomonas gellani]SEN32502.1 lipopolysaccharide export system permease protein [Sphingomonas gellani]
MLSAIFPSRTVALYMVRLFLVRTFGIVAGLVLVLLTLNLLSESGKILAVPGNGQDQIWTYVSLRGAELIAFAVPYSVLLGTILTLMQMNQNSEIIALKSSGLSAHQVLAPLLLASVGVALASFAFNDRVVTRATATLGRWQDLDYAAVPVDRGERTDVWVRNGDDLLEVDRIRGHGNAARLSGVTLYDRTGGNLMAILRAPHARREGNAWRVDDATRFDVASGKQTKLGSVLIAPGVGPDQFTLATVDADGLSFRALRSAIDDLDAAGRPTKALEGALWHKLSGPLSALLMPLLGAVAAFGIARSGKLFVRAVIGMALGFTYFVADNFALAMGNLGAYPPFLAAWAPFLLFFLIGEAVLIRTEE